MSTTTPDIRQLSTCCGKVLVWVEDWGRKVADCSACGSFVTAADDDSKPERKPTATEDLLLARIAELEAAQRWRVTAEELPPVGFEVFCRVGGGLPNVAVLEELGGWGYPCTGATGETGPDLWMPIPEVPIRKPGAP